MSDNSPQPEFRTPLYDFAFIRDFKGMLEKLSRIAFKENWEYSVLDPDRPLPILKNYILHTFARLKEENKIVEKHNYACINTGLITENQQEIFMLFKRFPERTNYTFIEFCNESDSNMNRFSPLPERASYYTDHADLTYDIRLQLRINIDHIIEDAANFARFPEHLQKTTKHLLINTFNGAIDHAKRRLMRNYKTAVPQFYRGRYNPNGQLQLLLPLCFSDPTKADLALAVYKVMRNEEHFYSGRTCLTLDMAINNARLIAKPDDEWLKP